MHPSFFHFSFTWRPGRFGGGEGWGALSRWALLLLVFAFLDILLIIWSAYVFVGVNKESLFLTSEGDRVSVETIDRTKVRTLVDFFATRKVLFEKYRTYPPSIPDPSR